MRFSRAALVAACVPAAGARFLGPLGSGGGVSDKNGLELFLVETAPGETEWVTEEEKWQLRKQNRNFMDVTHWPQLATHSVVAKPRVAFPQKCVHQEEVRELAKHLDKSHMNARLRHLSNYPTRFYKSDAGRQASDWILKDISDSIKRARAADVVSVKSFPHEWRQHSVIATIPGRTNSTIVIGAHLDSVNQFQPLMNTAPGADDDGSGTVTTMEVFDALLAHPDVAGGKAENTIEFHWYSAEEGGLLGSQAIFQSYKKDGRDVKAMLQQDMTGYVKGTIDDGQKESVGVVVDFVDRDLTDFIKVVIKEYCNIPFVETKCGYACSDHASASKAGYPSAFVIESKFEYHNPHIHTAQDTLDRLSFDHMLEHARMTLGLAYELGFHKFGDGPDESDEL
ncbi:hypothetical protein CDD83_748 [Cordyceps sp. RAO-2017]|nr:hypothetical protein CDD83_748 [Cordyceps sp. RAO-2017]